MNGKKYCDLKSFRVNYRLYNGYFSLFVCIFGSVANILNIVVLRTKPMWSPTNFILTGLAVADLFLMLEYTVFTYHRNLSPYRDYIFNFTYAWAIFFRFHAIFTQILHIVSCYLTVILAVWRYVYISCPQRNNICSNYKWTISVIVLTYLISPLICLPIILTTGIEAVFQRADSKGYMVLQEDLQEVIHKNTSIHNETIYVVQTHNEQLSIWVYSVIMKLFPCILLTVLSYKIIAVLSETKRRRRKLMGAGTPGKQLNGNCRSDAIPLYKENQADRTTRMLLVVLILFLVTEFPQAIFGIVIGIYGPEILSNCYGPLGDVIDNLALTNSAINFILYCTMSRQFRQAFKEVFGLNRLRRLSVASRTAPGERGAETAETKMSLI